MTDAPGLTPEQDAVRRLLAEARHDGSTPPEVVARLDDTLSSLVSERREAPLAQHGPGDRPAPVVDLGARRRRTAGFGLLAAAAVVVAGVAIGQGLPQMSGSDSSAGSAARGGSTASEDQDFGDGGGSDDSGAGADPSTQGQELAPQAKTEASDVPTLSTSDTDLDQYLADLRTTDPYRADLLGPAEGLSACDLRGIGRGRRVVAEVDGQAGVLVFRRPSGDVQDVAIYVCGDGDPVRTLTLPAP